MIYTIIAGILDDAKNIPQTIDATNADNQLKLILSIVFGIAGALAFLMVTIAGFMMVISAGEPQKVAKARQTIVYSVVGLVICIMAFSIVQFVVGKTP
jgi:uncharacterized membrane protein YidH (DUF202 family)